MRIAQIIQPGASVYERKSHLIDFEALRMDHEVVTIDARDLRSAAVDVAHVYGSPTTSWSDFRGIRVPYVSPSAPRPGRFSLRRPTPPARIISPVRDSAGVYVPEAVEDIWYDATRTVPQTPILGSYGRPDVIELIERTMARLHRFREDITWNVYDQPPTPDELACVSVWVDPATRDEDFDGLVAEALVAGVTVVAARTPLNAQRLEKGRTGFLVPPRDPNELTHAILAALFKPEAAREREIAARQTQSKFRVRQRLRALLALYESLIE